MPLLAWHISQISPQSSTLGVVMPGLMRAVANHTISKKMITTVRIKKNVFVSQLLFSLQRSKTVKRLIRIKLMKNTTSKLRILYNWDRWLGTALLHDSRPLVVCSFQEGFESCFRNIFDDKIHGVLNVLRFTCFVFATSFEIKYQYKKQTQPSIILNIRYLCQSLMRLIGNLVIEFYIYRYGSIFDNFSVSSPFDLYQRSIIKSAFIYRMINLSVTGKKVVSPNPPKKQPQIINSFIIQTKPISQKPQAPIKPKPFHIQTPKVPPKTPSAVKVQPKKQSPIKKQEKVQQKKAHQPVDVQQRKEEKIVKPEPIIEPKKENIIRQVTVRYNHYKQDFPSINGILSFLPIQQKYSFADVFKGKYLPVLKKFKSQEMIPPETIGLAVDYSWQVEEGEQYRLEITQDQEEELKYEKKAYKASDNPNSCPIKKNQRFEELTAQLKQLDPSQYGSAKHKALLEQRDLQDVLYS